MKHWIPRYLLTGLIACGIFGFSTMAFAGEWEEKATFPKLGAISGGAWLLGAEAVNGKIYAIGGHVGIPGITGGIHPQRLALPQGFFRLASS